MARFLRELLDVNASDTTDKNVLMFDDATQKWVSKNPDVLLNAASIEPVQPELPQDFTDELNATLVPVLEVDLDNQIDVDAGEF